MRVRATAIILLLGVVFMARAQLHSDSLGFFEKAEQPHKNRLFTVAGAKTFTIGGAYLGLYHLWYKDYSTGDFHFHNDWKNWQQVDKVGHAFSAYYLGYAGMELQDWAGLQRQKSAWVGGSLGFVFLTGIELMDAYSEGWGFSWGDMAANTFGTGLLIGQELLWQEQRMMLKFSYHPTDLAPENPELLGHSHLQRLFKDYNGHTYWLSANVQSLSGWQRWPAWLNLAVGYGADGMVTASYRHDLYQARDGVEWQRKYYLSLDLDLRKIPVKSDFLKAVFKAVNVIKVPLPTLELNQQDGLRFHPIYF